MAPSLALPGAAYALSQPILTTFSHYHNSRNKPFISCNLWPGGALFGSWRIKLKDSYLYELQLQLFFLWTSTGVNGILGTSQNTGPIYDACFSGYSFFLCCIAASWPWLSASWLFYSHVYKTGFKTPTYEREWFLFLKVFFFFFHDYV